MLELSVAGKDRTLRRPNLAELDISLLKRLLGIVLTYYGNLSELDSNPVPGTAKDMANAIAIIEDALTEIKSILVPALDAIAMDGTKPGSELGAMGDNDGLHEALGAASQLIIALGAEDSRYPKSSPPSVSRPKTEERCPAESGSSTTRPEGSCACAKTIPAFPACTAVSPDTAPESEAQTPGQ